MHNIRYRIDYLPSDLLMELIQHRWDLAVPRLDLGGVFVETTRNKCLHWIFAGHMPKKVYSDSIAMRRLFFVIIALHSSAKRIEKHMIAIKSIVSTKEDGSLPDKKISLARQKIIGTTKDVLLDPSPWGTISELLRLISLNFKKYAEDISKHHPFHLHTVKLNAIRTRLTSQFTQILEFCDTKLNDKNPINNPREIIKQVEECLQNFIAEISNEYHNIKDLIIVVDKYGFYSRSVATEIVQSFPKGSNKRAIASKMLFKEGRIPSEISMRRQLKWCETNLDSCKLSKPTIDQRWNRERGRKCRV